MSGRSEFLFSDIDIHQLSHFIQTNMLANIDNISSDIIINNTVDQICKMAIEEFILESPKIDEMNITQESVEADIDVSRNLRYFGGSTVRGTKVTYFIPFEGNPQMLDVTTASIGGARPIRDIRNNNICITCETPDHNVEEVNREFEQWLKKIQELLGDQADCIKVHNDRIRDIATQRIKQRREKVDNEYAFKEGLKYNQRKENMIEEAIKTTEPDITATSSLPSTIAIPEKDSDDEYNKGAKYSLKESNLYEWDFFISHASEDKSSIVRQLADQLKANGFNVWYDEFALKIGDSLHRSIETGLARSRFGIVVLSKYFFKKEWPQKELDGLVSREGSGNKIILPIWHEITKDEVAHYSPILADRIAAKTSDGFDNLIEAIQLAITGKVKKEIVNEPWDWFLKAYNSKDYYEMLFYYSKAIELKPDYCEAHYNMACLFGRRHNELKNNDLDMQKALDSLKRAADSGFYKLKYVQNDEDLVSLRGHKKFEEILEIIKNNRELRIMKK